MMRLFKVGTKLPEHNQYVLAHLVTENRGDDSDPKGDRYWVVVKFKKGLTLEDRKTMSSNDVRVYEFRDCDVKGNNMKPYCWDSFGPSSYFGQCVDMWCALPGRGADYYE